VSAPHVADALLEAVVEASRDDMTRGMRHAQWTGRPNNAIRAVTAAVLRVVSRDPTQSSELIERLSAENRKLRDELRKAEQTARRLQSWNVKLVNEREGARQDAANSFATGARINERLSTLRQAVQLTADEDRAVAWLQKQRGTHAKRLYTYVDRVYYTDLDLEKAP
jgi:small-conductance mechanosensitive channel